MVGFAGLFFLGEGERTAWTGLVSTPNRERLLAFGETLHGKPIDAELRERPVFDGLQKGSSRIRQTARRFGASSDAHS